MPKSPIDQLLSTEESESCDFTRVLNTDSFLKKVCAMANTRGGIILLGIEDSRKASGRDRLFGIHEKNPEMYDKITNAEAREILGKSANQVSKILSQWVDNEELIVVGTSRKYRSYRLNTPGDQFNTALSHLSDLMSDIRKGKPQ
jgi:predicted HTH transcriptional regulator